MYPTSVLDASQRKAARVAGAAFLSAIAIVVLANYGISFRLIRPNDAVETARNILAHETLFRINVACNLLYGATLLVLLTGLYAVLKPVDKALAMFAAACRMVVVLMWAATALSTLGALRLLGDAAYLSTLRPEQLQTLARLGLSTSYDAYYVGLPFWGLASTLCAWLWLKSGYISKAMAIYGLLASAWCVGCAFAFIAIPHFDRMLNASWYDLPLLLFELALGFRLLFKGLRPGDEVAS